MVNNQIVTSLERITIKVAIETWIPFSRSKPNMLDSVTIMPPGMKLIDPKTIDV